MTKKQQKDQPLTREPGKKKVATKFAYPETFKLTPKPGENPTAIILGKSEISVTHIAGVSSPPHPSTPTHPTSVSPHSESDEKLAVRLTDPKAALEGGVNEGAVHVSSGPLTGPTAPTHPTAVPGPGGVVFAGDPAASRTLYFTPAEVKVLQYAVSIRLADGTFWLRLKEAMSLASIGSKNTVQDAVRRLEDKGIFRRLYYRSGLRAGIRYEFRLDHLQGAMKGVLEQAIPKLRGSTFKVHPVGRGDMGGVGATAVPGQPAALSAPGDAGSGDTATGAPGVPNDDDRYDDDLHTHPHQYHLVENQVPREIKELFMQLSLLPWKAAFDDDYAALVHALHNQGISPTLEVVLSTMKIIGLRAKLLGNPPHSFRFFLTAIPRELQKETNEAEDELRLIWSEIQHTLVGQQEKPPISELAAKLKDRASERGIPYTPAMIEKIVKLKP